MPEIVDSRSATQKVGIGKKYGMGTASVKEAVLRAIKRKV